MALFILLLLLFNLNYLLGSHHGQDVKVIISPHFQGPAQFRLEDTLNLTCSLNTELNDIHLEWVMPSKAANSQNKVDMITGSNSLNMVIRNLQENDSGDYKCTASSNTNPDLMDEKSIRVNVKQRKCAEMMFLCSPTSEKCIYKYLTCDGKKDCKNGEDESEKHCGPNPCGSKLRCANGRCIPTSWCCNIGDFLCARTNTSGPCCQPPGEFPDDGGYVQENQRYNDVAFFQTTVYTVIGCAMAFMFIVTILVIAICRVHMRRTMMPRCPVNRANCRPSSHFNPLNPLNNLPFYDLDMLFNRNNDVMSVNPLLVTYNINNGVQFVGRPVDPPPYCEIMATPPREGPPPPYASHENISIRRASRTEAGDSESEEPKESDSLLTRQPSISVISCNNMTTASNAGSTYVVNLTEDGLGGSPMLTVVETQILPSLVNPIAITIPPTNGEPSTVRANQDSVPSTNREPSGGGSSKRTNQEQIVGGASRKSSQDVVPLANHEPPAYSAASNVAESVVSDPEVIKAYQDKLNSEPSLGVTLSSEFDE